MTYFKNKTVIMSGGSRGVGLEIAKALGKDGANIAILAKTTEPHILTNSAPEQSSLQQKRLNRLEALQICQ